MNVAPHAAGLLRAALPTMYLLATGEDIVFTSSWTGWENAIEVMIIIVTFFEWSFIALGFFMDALDETAVAKRMSAELVAMLEKKTDTRARWTSRRAVEHLSFLHPGNVSAYATLHRFIRAMNSFTIGFHCPVPEVMSVLSITYAGILLGYIALYDKPMSMFVVLALVDGIAATLVSLKIFSSIIAVTRSTKKVIKSTTNVTPLSLSLTPSSLPPADHRSCRRPRRRDQRTPGQVLRRPRGWVRSNAPSRGDR